ncbi:hypothetical protein HYX05_00310 [Candidatus Woesearchaeota archaeon]|nr:hypothetical protein [Candidatus Woesearchaeota archaeon]
MEINQVIRSYGTWRTLIGDWYGLERLLFDDPGVPNSINLRKYLESVNESIEGQFSILEFVLNFYGNENNYMKRKKSGSDTRNQTDYFCSQNNLLAFRQGIVHFEHSQVEDMERLLRHYWKDTEHPKPLQTTLPPSPYQASK